MKKVSRILVALMAIVMIVTTIPATALADDSCDWAEFDVVVTTAKTPLLDIVTGEVLCTVPKGTWMTPLGVVHNYEMVRFCGFLGCISLRDVSPDIVEIPMLLQCYLKQDATFYSPSQELMIKLAEGTKVTIFKAYCNLWSWCYFEGTFGLIPNDCLDGTVLVGGDCLE